MQDLESKTLLECMNMIAALPEDAQGRVMAYLSDRFLNGVEVVVAPTVSAAPKATTGKKRGPKPGTKRKTTSSASSTGKRGRKPSKSKKSDYSEIKDLDLAPAGKQSLKEFYAQVNPKVNHEIHLTMLYYFQHVLGMDGITISHIYTAQKKLKTKMPKNLYQSMLQTSSTEKNYDTSDVNNLKTTAKGKKLIESKLS